MKNWRDKAKWWVGTDELTFNMLSISNSHYIHLHELTMERYISPTCNSDKGSIRASPKPYYDHQAYDSFLVVIKQGISVLKNLT
jgi:hypothetical protein